MQTRLQPSGRIPGLRKESRKRDFLQTLLIRKILKPTGFTVVEHAVGLLIKICLVVMNLEVIFLKTAVKRPKTKIGYAGGQHYFS